MLKKHTCTDDNNKKNDVFKKKKKEATTNDCFVLINVSRQLKHAHKFLIVHHHFAIKLRHSRCHIHFFFCLFCENVVTYNIMANVINLMSFYIFMTLTSANNTSFSRTRYLNNAKIMRITVTIFTHTECVTVLLLRPNSGSKSLNDKLNSSKCVVKSMNYV